MSCSNCTQGLPCSQTRVAGTDAGNCDRLIFDAIVTENRLKIFKERVNADVIAIDKAVEGCAALSQAQRDGWNTFLLAWLPFYQKEIPFFGKGGEWDETCAYSKQIDGWREQLSKSCVDVPGPIKGRDTKDAVDIANAIAGGLKGLAVIAAIAGGVYVLTASGVFNLLHFKKSS